MIRRTILAPLCAIILAVGLLAAIPLLLTSSATATEDGGETTCVPAEAYTETTDWVTESPGEGWYQVEERTIEGTPDLVEYRFKVWVPEYKTRHQYNKQTKTVVRHGNGNSAPILVSDWSWWPGNTPKWSFDDVEVLESGDHGNWTERHGGHTDYYDRDYRYVKTGQSEQVEDGGHWEYSEWLTESPGEGWVKYDERTTPGTPDSKEYRFAFDHPAVECPTDPTDPTDPPTTDTPDPEPEPEPEPEEPTVDQTPAKTPKVTDDAPLPETGA